MNTIKCGKVAHHTEWCQFFTNEFKEEVVKLVVDGCLTVAAVHSLARQISHNQSESQYPTFNDQPWILY